ncbi:MAG: ribosome maturation factor RimP [Micavibrio sp.]|nr:MAG: ribosome maturation factor RimP [Micavibrio sp.]
MKNTPLEKRIVQLVTPILEDMGFELVRVRLIGGTNNPNLQIMAEPVDESRSMSVEDCAEISHEISAVLDVEDPIEGRYTLEISSPGLDRPLTRPKDFVRSCGMEARIEIEPPFEGQKRFKGRILAVSEEEGGFTLETEDGEHLDIAFTAVVRAKLVLSDEMINFKQA